MLTVKGIQCRYADGSFRGYCVLCHKCDTRIWLLRIGSALVVENPDCPHYLSAKIEEAMIFDETEDGAKERERERATENAIAREIDERRRDGQTF